MQNSLFLGAVKGKVLFNKLGRESCQMQFTDCCVLGCGTQPQSLVWALEMQDGLEEGANPLLSKTHIYLYICCT